MTRYVVAIDQGTTGSTVLLLSENLDVVSRGYAEFAQIYPSPGLVEHDPEVLWQSVLSALQQALHQATCRPQQIVAIGVTNQRETTVCLGADGLPLYNAIVWQDRRTASRCEQLRAAGHLPDAQFRTGLVLDPYFSATKIEWMLTHVPGLRAQAERGQARFGTIDTFLVHRLSGGQAWVTDPSNASRTLLYNLRERRFDDTLCALFSVPPQTLPTVVPSQGICAHTRGVPGLPDGIPIAGLLGDQQAALFGQMCFSPGQAKCTYGTGAFLLLNTGPHIVPSKNGLLTTVAWQDQDQTFCYALEGSAFVAGAMVQWLRDGLGLISSAREIEDLARKVPDSGGVVAVPALAGLGAPHWRPEARGLLSGLSRGTTAGHIARAVLEGIALQNCDLLQAMEADSGLSLASLRVDGGAAQNDLLMQLQADFLGVQILRPKMLESTALGAGLAAGLGVGLWKNPQQVAAVAELDRTFLPGLSAAQVKTIQQGWRQAVARA